MGASLIGLYDGVEFRVGSEPFFFSSKTISYEVWICGIWTDELADEIGMKLPDLTSRDEEQFSPQVSIKIKNG